MPKATALFDRRPSAVTKPSNDEATIEHRHRNRVSAAPCRKPLGARCRPTRFGSLSRMIENFRSKLRKKLANNPNIAAQVRYRRVRKPQRRLSNDSATGCGGWGGGKEVIG
ncbi:hypothetical protein D3C81_1708380 [compost metagenome]